jgi:hypothetical protein
LIKRQQALLSAWQQLKDANPDNWPEVWDKTRREALEAGGFEVVF